MESQIEYIYETDFFLNEENRYSSWLVRCSNHYGADSLFLAFAFMDDKALHALNLQHLQHDTLTDIITFDDSVGKEICANIAISVERIKANALTYSVSFETELLRVMAHGLLHCLGFSDKTSAAVKEMRAEEDFCINLFHVEHKNATDV